MTVSHEGIEGYVLRTGRLGRLKPQPQGTRTEYGNEESHHIWQQFQSAHPSPKI